MQTFPGERKDDIRNSFGKKYPETTGLNVVTVRSIHSSRPHPQNPAMNPYVRHDTQSVQTTNRV